MDPGRFARRAVRDGWRAIALLAGVMALVGCSRIEVPEEPSVVVITLDTTRADHLSTLGQCTQSPVFGMPPPSSPRKRARRSAFMFGCRSRKTSFAPGRPKR